MDVEFTRRSDARVVVKVERDDGAILETSSPGGHDRLPHDLIHYVVERELGIDDGFWARLAAGVTYKNFRVVAPPVAKRSPSSPRRARRSPLKRKGVLEAEVLVGIFHDIWDGTAEREWGSVRAFLDTIWSPRTRSRADELDDATIRRVCRALDETEAAWRRVGAGESLRVSWPQQSVRHSLSSSR